MPGETVTIAGDTVTITVPGEPVTVTVEAEPTTVTVEAEPVTVTVEGEPTTVTVEAEPVTVTVETAAKTSPTFTLSDWEVDDTVYSAAITYNGDGTLSTNLGTINNNTLIVPDDDGNFFGKVTASEGTNYAAGNFFFQFFTDKDTTLNTMIKAMDSLVVWLPFDSSITQDLCGGTWAVSGSPSIQDGALYVEGASYVARSGGYTMGARDFTFSCYFYAYPNIAAVLFYLSQSAGGYNQRVYCLFTDSNPAFYLLSWGDARKDVSVTRPTDWFHWCVTYKHSETMLRAFIDGVKVAELNKTIPYAQFAMLNTGYSTRDKFSVKGKIREWQLYNGVALWTEDFTPPTAEEYAALRAAWDKKHS